MLGGGHGYLQGFYGLISDQLISAHVVLATGEIVVVSASDNSDLFWALQGAGHNFGIVTEVTARVYDVPETNWAYVQYIYTHDKVEALFTQINNWTANGTQELPLNFVNKNVFARIPPIDADNVSQDLPRVAGVCFTLRVLSRKSIVHHAFLLPRGL